MVSVRNLVTVYAFIWTSCYLAVTVHAKRKSTLAKDNSKVCNAKKCKKVADRIKANLNTDVKPCDDFYEFACGGWRKKHSIPKGKDEYSAIVELSEHNDKQLKKLLKTENASDIRTIRKVKDFYKSCLNTKLINERGNRPLIKFIKDLGSWDIFPDFDAESWDFNKTLQKFHKEFPAEIFFTVDVDVDPKNRSMNIVTVSLFAPFDSVCCIVLQWSVLYTVYIEGISIIPSTKDGGEEVLSRFGTFCC